MRYTKKDLKTIATNLLIGQQIEIIKSYDKTLIGVKGRVVDETLKTLTIDGGKKISKAVVTLQIRYKDKSLVVDGKDLLQRPEERLKKLWRKAA